MCFGKKLNFETSKPVSFVGVRRDGLQKAAAMALLVQDPWRVVHWWVWSGALLGMGPAYST